ncbi:MAG TPA: universal stress protein [Streptosporangiaceae bacterium]|nr:universal stress protein [Streptosporangiaceae bacterium]
MNEIIAGVDGSPCSLRAIEWAAEAAAARGTALRIVHAMPSWLFEPTVESRVEQVRDWMVATGHEVTDEAVAVAEARAPGLDVSAELAPGGPPRALIGAAKDAVMLVVGSHGAGTLTGLLLGSVALQVAMHAICPAVVVRPPPVSARREVVVGIDGSHHDQAVMEFGFTEASLRSARLRAVHAWTHLGAAPDAVRPPVVDRAAAEAECQRMLAESLGGWQERFPEVEIVREVRHDRPTAALTAASAGAELLVVGTRGRGGFAGLLLGSVGHAMLHRAQCPVAIVPAPGR